MNSRELGQAISFLLPNAEFVIQDGDYSTIVWHKIEGNPPSFADIEAAHQAVKAAEAQAQAEAQAKRQALLNKLGITEEEARLLLGGN